MPRISATPTRAARHMTPACAIAALRTRRPAPTGSTAQVNPAVANATDQYLPKHFPFPWFESILKSGDCNSRHIASLFDRTNGLYRDLQRESTTPAFSWITPNMCSDGHDAVCYGNNLSGGFSGPTTPRAPVNYTGGLYSADLFLKHVVPEIERSAAFKDGGLIDITFDEGVPTVHLHRRQLRELEARRAERGDVDRGCARPPRHCSAAACTSSRPGRTRRSPRTLTATSCTPVPASTRTSIARATVFSRRSRACRQGPASSAAASTSQVRAPDAAATAAPGSSTIADNAAVATDPGRSVTGAGIPAGAFVGKVTDTPVNATAPNESGGFVGHRLVHARGLLRAPAADDRRGQRRRARSADPGQRPAVRRAGRDDRRWGHRQRADQPLHPPAHHEHRLLQPLQLAAHDRGPVQRRPRLQGPGRSGSHRLRRPARTRAVRRDVFNHPPGPARTRDQAGTAESRAGCRSPPSQRTATLQASGAHPVLAIQGDTVAVAVRDAQGARERRRTDRAAPRPSPDPDHQPVHVHRHVHRRPPKRSRSARQRSRSSTNSVTSTTR